MTKIIKNLLFQNDRKAFQKNNSLSDVIYEFVWSYILDYENNKNPFKERKEQIGKWKLHAQTNIEEDETVINLAKSTNQLGLKSLILYI